MNFHPRGLFYLDYFHSAVILSLKKKKNHLKKLHLKFHQINCLDKVALGSHVRPGAQKMKEKKCNLHKAHKTSCLVFGKQLGNTPDILQFHSSVKEKYVSMCHPRGLTSGGGQGIHAGVSSYG